MTERRCHGGWRDDEGKVYYSFPDLGLRNSSVSIL